MDRAASPTYSCRSSSAQFHGSTFCCVPWSCALARPLLSGGVTPELRKTWTRVMTMCLLGLSCVGPAPAAFHAKALFGWLANAESLDVLATRAAA
eukprot:2184303-Amphidinium_carterae.1